MKEPVSIIFGGDVINGFSNDDNKIPINIDLTAVADVTIDLDGTLYHKTSSLDNIPNIKINSTGVLYYNDSIIGYISEVEEITGTIEDITNIEGEL